MDQTEHHESWLASHLAESGISYASLRHCVPRRQSHLERNNERGDAGSVACFPGSQGRILLWSVSTCRKQVLFTQRIASGKHAADKRIDLADRLVDRVSRTDTKQKGLLVRGRWRVAGGGRRAEATTTSQ